MPNRGGPRVEHLKPQQRRQVEQMLAKGLSGYAIAAKLKINRTYVSLVRKALREALEATVAGLPAEVPSPRKARDISAIPHGGESAGAEEKLRERRALKMYRRSIRKELPIKTRARLIGELARGDDAANVRWALSHADEIDGFQQEAKQQAPQPPGPLFILPAPPPNAPGGVAILLPLPQARPQRVEEPSDSRIGDQGEDLSRGQ